MPDTFDKYGGEIEGASESKGKQNGQLMGGVDTVDIKTRIRLCITQSLRLCQHLVKCGAIGLHLTKNVVAGAVNDAKQPPQAIRGGPPDRHCMIGIAPATAASKRSSCRPRPAMSSLPCAASMALFAVTTGLLAANPRRIKSSAVVSPPINSKIISTLGSVSRSSILVLK